MLNFFLWKGRCNRKEYWSFYLSIVIILLLLWFPLVTVNTTTWEFDNFLLVYSILLIRITLIGWIIITYLSIVTVIRRFHDFSQPWYLVIWICICMFLLLVQLYLEMFLIVLWLTIILFWIIPWTNWPNKYWPDPLKKDGNISDQSKDTVIEL